MSQDTVEQEQRDVGRINTLTQRELKVTYRFAVNLNNDYRRHIYQLVQTNKDIPAFATFKYTELIEIDKAILDYLDGLASDVSGENTTAIHGEDEIITVEELVGFQEVYVTYKPRKHLPNNPYVSGTVFKTYQNFYSQNYGGENDLKLRMEYNSKLNAKAKEKLSKSTYLVSKQREMPIEVK